MTGRRRLGSPERRTQIIEVTLGLVAERGVADTTVQRIAAAAGVGASALYAHFTNRQEILVAALEVLIQRRTALHRRALIVHDNALDRLSEMGRRHSELVAEHSDASVFALFEFIVAPPHEGLRDTLGARHLSLIEDMAEVIRAGQEEGSVIGEADPEQVAWMMLSRAWTEDIAQLMGLTGEWSRARSDRMLDLILNSIATSGDWKNPKPD